jgi:polyhydroxybutyrate depolymerase
MLFLLHGRTGSGEEVGRYTRFYEKCASDGIVGVYPDALGNPTGWNAGYNSGRNNGDDLAYLARLLDFLRAETGADSSRVYMAGHSSGAMMTFNFAVHRASELAAIGVVAGSVGAKYPGEPLMMLSEPSDPLSVMMIHGKKDAIVPYGEEDKASAKYSHFLPVSESVQFWVRHNGCHPEPRVIRSADGLIVEEWYSGGSKDTEVGLCTLLEGNHHWPGGRDLESTGGIQPNQELSATDRLWLFFQQHGIKI